MPEAFEEDFFERVVNVKWETEFKVLWMAGTGFPFIVNGLNGGNPIIRYVFDSENGHNWNATDYGLHSGALGKPGLGAIYGGAWMRQNLEAGGVPVWMMTGGDGRLQMGSCEVSSRDGVFLHKEVNWDDVHVGNNFGIYQYPAPPTPQNPKGGGGRVYCNSLNTFGRFQHEDIFNSSDGESWSPANYHGGVDLSGLSARDAAATRVQSKISSPAICINTPEPERVLENMHKTLYLPVPETLITPAPALLHRVEPRASTPSSKEARTVFITSAHAAGGKVRKGPLAGKSVFVAIEPFSPLPPAHGGSALSIYDGTTGRLLTKANCGITRTICLNYGYYTFCVGGSSGSGSGQGAGQRSTIAYSDDLLNWRVIELGQHDQVNCLVAGPYKGALTPTGPTGATSTEPTTSTVVGPTGLSIP